MPLEAAVTEPLPIGATAGVVLLVSVALVGVWLAYLSR